MAAALERASILLRKDHTLGTVLERLAKVRRDSVLVEEAASPDALTLTFGQAAKRVARWAGGVAATCPAGSVVVVAGRNSYEQLLLCLAVSRAGCIPAPVNDMMRAEEVDHVVADSGAVKVLRSAREVDGYEPLPKAVPADPEAVAALFYTSGTTGKPKGAALTHRALVGQVMRAAAWPGEWRSEEAVLSLPVAHIMGFASLLGMAGAGVPVYFIRRFNPVEVLDALEQRHAAIFIGVPAMYRMMLEAGAAERDLKSVRMWGSGADVMPAELAAQFKRFGSSIHLPIVGDVGEAIFFEGYGMVETGGGVAAKFSPPFLPLGLGDSLGFSAPGYKMRVVGEDGDEVRTGETGELQVKGPGVLKGYWGDEAATGNVLTEDGWLRTGDMARRGPMGMVLFAGRGKDVIKRGGFSVYSVEVEACLEEHPDVLEAAVVPLPDERLGEVPGAAVRLAPGVTLDEDDILAFAKDHLADYKVPTRVIAVEDFPRTGTRKIQRREVVALF
jgi:long-chain acyl-CoA synthetase